MAIFKNTPSQNRELWRVKHMIEIRPLIFPNGEPTMDDINSLEVAFRKLLYQILR